MRKRMAFLKRRADMGRREFFDWWLNDHRALAENIPGLRRYAISLVADDDDGAFDGVGELWFDSNAAAEAGFASPAGQTVRASGTAHTAHRESANFVEHKFIDTGEPAPFKMVAALKRAAGMTRPEFKDWWLGSHVPMVLKFPELRHYQVDLVEDGPDGAMDGIAELSFKDMPTMMRVMTSDQVRNVQQEDSVSHASSIIRMHVRQHPIF